MGRTVLCLLFVENKPRLASPTKATTEHCKHANLDANGTQYTTVENSLSQALSALTIQQQSIREILRATILDKRLHFKLLNRIFNNKRDLSIANPLPPYQCCLKMIPECMLVTIDAFLPQTTLIRGQWGGTLNP